MISNTIFSPQAFSSAARRKFWFGNLYILLATLFVYDTWHWLDRAATGAFWRNPVVHGTGMVILGIYSVLAARTFTRLTRYIVASSDLPHSAD